MLVTSLHEKDIVNELENVLAFTGMFFSGDKMTKHQL